MTKVLRYPWLVLLVLLLAGWVYSNRSHVQKLDVRSNALGESMRVNIYLPPDYSPSQRYPVLYVLHGRDSNADSWFGGFAGINALHLDRKADALITSGQMAPMIIVAPQIDNSFGLNSAAATVHGNGYRLGRYEDWIVQDLIPYVDSHYSTVTGREGRSIGGISMGGYAALRLAFAHPDLFAKVGGHSPGLRNDVDMPEMLAPFFPTAAAMRAAEPLNMARTASLEGLSIWLDYGDHDHDHIRVGVGELAAVLQGRGAQLQVHTAPGGHDYGNWSAQAENWLRFYSPAK